MTIEDYLAALDEVERYLDKGILREEDEDYFGELVNSILEYEEKYFSTYQLLLGAWVDDMVKTYEGKCWRGE